MVHTARTDGSWPAAWSTAATWGPEAEAALAAHDAHGLLAARGQTLRLGATGTNLNDLWIVLAQE